MDLSWFWKKNAYFPEKTVNFNDSEADLVVVSSPVDEFVMVADDGVNEDDIEKAKQADHSEELNTPVVMVVDNANDEGIENLKPVDNPERLNTSVVLETPIVEEKIEHSVKQNFRKERWEKQYPKVFATVTDLHGDLFEVRRVNHNKQLAFWDCHHNTQVYVYPKKNSEQLETKEKMLLSIRR
jgi:hypothetical protein